MIYGNSLGSYNINGYPETISSNSRGYLCLNYYSPAFGDANMVVCRILLNHLGITLSYTKGDQTKTTTFNENGWN